MPEEPANRIDRIVRDLLKGRRLKIGPADASERESILAAVRLAAAREGYPRMSPGFKRRLAGSLGGAVGEGWVTRRAALVGGLGAALGAVVGVGATRLGDFGSGQGGAGSKVVPAWQQAVVDPRPGRWVDVGALADLAEGPPQRVQAGSVGAYVFRRGDKVAAVSSVCSHLPCELAWKSGSGMLNCPCHNQDFKPNGESAGSYPLPPLASVQVRVVDGRIQVFGT
jgi:nitrite reductase/ring-hydroxylating ferredoxin subunit